MKRGCAATVYRERLLLQWRFTRVELDGVHEWAENARVLCGQKLADPAVMRIGLNIVRPVCITRQRCVVDNRGDKSMKQHKNRAGVGT